MGVSRESNHCCDGVTTILTDSEGIIIWKRNFSTDTIDTDISDEKIFSIGHFRQIAHPVIEELKTYDISGNQYQYYSLLRSSSIENIDYSSLDYFGNTEKSHDLFNFGKGKTSDFFFNEELHFREFYENDSNVITYSTGIVYLNSTYPYYNEYQFESGTDSRIFHYGSSIFVLSDNIINENTESGTFKSFHLFSDNINHIPYKNMDIYDDKLFMSNIYHVADFYLETGNLIKIKISEPYIGYDTSKNYRFNIDIDNSKWLSEFLGNISIRGKYSGIFTIDTLNIPSGYNFISSGIGDGLVIISGFSDFINEDYQFSFNSQNFISPTGHFFYSISGNNSHFIPDESFNLNYTFSKSLELLNKKQDKFYYQDNKIFNMSEEVASGYMIKTEVIPEHSFRDNILYKSKYELKSNLNSYQEMSKAIHRRILMISLKSFFLIKQTDENGNESWFTDRVNLSELNSQQLDTINKYWVNTGYKWLWKKIDYVENTYYDSVTASDPGFFLNIYNNTNHPLNPTYAYMNVSGIAREIDTITPLLTEDSNLFVRRATVTSQETFPAQYPILMHNKSIGLNTGNIKTITYEKCLFVPSGFDDFYDIVNFVNERYILEPYQKIKLPVYDWREFGDIISEPLIRKGFKDNYFANAASYESATDFRIFGSRKYSYLDFAYTVNNEFPDTKLPAINIQQKLTSYDLKSFYVGHIALMNLESSGLVLLNNKNTVSISSTNFEEEVPNDYIYGNNTCLHDIKLIPQEFGHPIIVKNIKRFLNNYSGVMYKVLDENNKLICITDNWLFGNNTYPFTQNINIEYLESNDIVHTLPLDILDNHRHNLYLDINFNSGICYDLFFKDLGDDYNSYIHNYPINYITSNASAEYVFYSNSQSSSRHNSELDKSSDIEIISDKLEFKDYSILDSFPDYYIGYGYIDNISGYVSYFNERYPMLDGTRIDRKIYNPNELEYQQHCNRLTIDNTDRFFRSKVKYSKMFDDYISKGLVDDVRENIHNSGVFKNIMDGYSHSTKKTELRINRPRIKHERI